jgi:predicted metal-dependent peptidase
MLDKINEPVIDWSDKFHGAFTRKVGDWRYNWRKPDRRLITRDIIAPAKSRYGAGDIFIAGDTSGSMSQKEISQCLGIVAGVLEQVSPRRLAVIWCDNQVRRVDEVEDVFDLERIQKEGTSGGWGTSFVPVFDWIKNNTDETPSALIYFTDGDGDFPTEKPDYPVFWCNIQPGKTYPWGDVIDVPVAAYKGYK